MSENIKRRCPICGTISSDGYWHLRGCPEFGKLSTEIIEQPTYTRAQVKEIIEWIAVRIQRDAHIPQTVIDSRFDDEVEKAFIYAAKIVRETEI